MAALPGRLRECLSEGQHTVARPSWSSVLLAELITEHRDLFEQNRMEEVEDCNDEITEHILSFPISEGTRALCGILRQFPLNEEPSLTASASTTQLQSAVSPSLRFVYQFLPVLLRAYLTLVATSLPSTVAGSDLEGLLVDIYSKISIDKDGNARKETIRIPSVSAPSVFHEPEVAKNAVQITAKTLSHLNSFEAVQSSHYPPIDRVTKATRALLTTRLLGEYNTYAAFLPLWSRKLFCTSFSSLVSSGFPSWNASLGAMRRIPVSEALLQEVVRGAHLALFSGTYDLALELLEDAHHRATFEGFSSVLLVTTAALQFARMSTKISDNSLSLTAGFPELTRETLRNFGKLANSGKSKAAVNTQATAAAPAAPAAAAAQGVAAQQPAGGSPGKLDKGYSTFSGLSVRVSDQDEEPAMEGTVRKGRTSRENIAPVAVAPVLIGSAAESKAVKTGSPKEVSRSAHKSSMKDPAAGTAAVPAAGTAAAGGVAAKEVHFDLVVGERRQAEPDEQSEVYLDAQESQGQEDEVDDKFESASSDEDLDVTVTSGAAVVLDMMSPGLPIPAAAVEEPEDGVYESTV